MASRVTRALLDDLLEQLNRQCDKLDAPRQTFYITNPGDAKGTRYQLKRADTWADTSWVMNGREMERVLRTSIKLNDTILSTRRQDA